MVARNSGSRPLVPVFVLVLGAGASGCAAAAEFEPAHPTSSVGASYAASEYEMNIGGAVLGDAMVWSGAAPESQGSAGEGRELDVELAIHNSSGQPLSFEVGKSSVSVTASNGTNALVERPARVGGSRVVTPNSTARVGLHYALPAGLRSSDVTRFDFKWRVTSALGEYVQSTEFVPLPVQGTEAFVDRGQPCGAVYRVATPHECVGVFPILAK